ncbi:MAG: serine/threonine-protein kinase, partial [Terriglobales bacterium]
RLHRFELEARTVAALNHPNILALFDIGTHDGSPYIVSELLEGQTLRQRLEEGPLPARRAVEFALQASQGLAAAHEKSVVHRDVKPENIFLTKDGRVKILDFGLAKLARPEGAASGSDSPTLGTTQTAAGMVMGTMGYMSPEQVRGKTIDPRSDIFSFGAVVYEMLAGKRAFQGETSADTLTAILQQDPPELTQSGLQVSPALDRIVRRCLEKEASDRFQGARDLGYALDAVMGSSAPAPEAPAAEARKKSPTCASCLLSHP